MLEENMGSLLISLDICKSLCNIVRPSNFRDILHMNNSVNDL